MVNKPTIENRPEELKPLAVGWVTKTGCPLAVVLMVKKSGGKPEEQYCCSKLTASLDPLTFSSPAYTDPYLLDYELAEHLIQAVPGNITVAGATVAIPRALGPSGGVLGSTRKNPVSADSSYEQLTGGLGLSSFPGGPGLIIRGDPLLAYAILCSLPTGTGGTAVLTRAAILCHNYNISLMIGISDGTGTPCPGAVIIMEERKQKTLDLQQIHRSRATSQNPLII